MGDHQVEDLSSCSQFALLLKCQMTFATQWSNVRGVAGHSHQRKNLREEVPYFFVHLHPYRTFHDDHHELMRRPSRYRRRRPDRPPVTIIAAEPPHRVEWTPWHGGPGSVPTRSGFPLQSHVPSGTDRRRGVLGLGCDRGQRRGGSRDAGGSRALDLSCDSGGRASFFNPIRAGSRSGMRLSPFVIPCTSKALSSKMPHL